MNKPNFFIVGAPKCGTTALYEYLRVHPNIYMSIKKEPHYFAEDFYANYRGIRTLEQYLKLFDDATQEHLAIGEASVFYLYSSTAIKKIRSFAPKAKIIVMVRNPIELIYSYHSQLIYSSNENEQNFEQAWNLQLLRQEGKCIPSSCRVPQMLQYSEIGKLGKQVKKLFEIFPSEQIKIIVFEELKNSTKSIYEDILDFLEVPSDDRREFPRINTNKTHKIMWLGQFIQKPPLPILNFSDGIKNMLGLESFYLGRTMQRLNKLVNVEVTSRPPLNEKFRQKLIDEYQDDIKDLSNLLNRDLSDWMR